MGDKLYYHPESDSYLIEDEEEMSKNMEKDINAAHCEDVTDSIQHRLLAVRSGQVTREDIKRLPKKIKGD